MCKRLFAAVAVFAIIFGISSPAFASGKTGPMNCSDFDTWKQAQNYYEDHGGPNEDPSDLDRDNDGQACEGLPGFDPSYQPSTSNAQGNSQDNSDDHQAAQENTNDQNTMSDNNNQQQATQSNDNDKMNKSQGAEMPDTSSNNPAGLLLGGLIVALGAILLFVPKRVFNS